MDTNFNNIHLTLLAFLLGTFLSFSQKDTKRDIENDSLKVWAKNQLASVKDSTKIDSIAKTKRLIRVYY